MLYTVAWDITLEADDPREAALIAHEIMLDEDSDAVVFYVYSEGDGATETVIDLLEKEDDGGPDDA